MTDAAKLRTRAATPADAAAIAAIYNEGIADRIATFETEPRTPEQIAAQLTDKGDRFPTVVAERAGRIDELGNGRFARSLFERACACRDDGRRPTTGCDIRCRSARASARLAHDRAAGQ